MSNLDLYVEMKLPINDRYSNSVLEYLCWKEVISLLIYINDRRRYKKSCCNFTNVEVNKKGNDSENNILQ